MLVADNNEVPTAKLPLAQPRSVECGARVFHCRLVARRLTNSPLTRSEISKIDSVCVQIHELMSTKELPYEFLHIRL